MSNEKITIHKRRINNGELVEYARILSQKNHGTIVQQELMLYRLTPQQLNIARHRSK